MLSYHEFKSFPEIVSLSSLLKTILTGTDFEWPGNIAKRCE
jgi:hypothetical protein